MGVKCELQEDARTLVSVVSRLYPCQDCAEDLRTDLLQHPPRVTSSKEFSQGGRTVLAFFVTFFELMCKTLPQTVRCSHALTASPK